MSVSDLKKVKAKRVMGIDCNTYSLAWCVFYNRRPEKWGKITFKGSDVFARMADAAQKVHAMADQFDVDYIVFEGAILAKVQNAATTIKLAMMYGVCIAELMNQGTTVITANPLEWQSFIGNPNFTKAEKEAVKAQFPGKGASFYSEKIRGMRKQKTMDFFNKKWPKMHLTDDDVGDSCGLAYFAYYKKTMR